MDLFWTGHFVVSGIAELQGHRRDGPGQRDDAAHEREHPLVTLSETAISGVSDCESGLTSAIDQPAAVRPLAGSAHESSWLPS